MNALLFALVDAVQMSLWAGEFRMYRRWRWNAHLHGDAVGRKLAHKQMACCRVYGTGEWRSLWGVL